MRSNKRKAISISCSVVALSMLFLMGDVTARAEGPIKIGAFFALSGPAASIGTPTKLVAQMGVDKINKEGGINKRPLELATGDTESDPTKAKMVALRLVENDKVVALIGPTRTDEGLAAKPYVEDTAHRPVIMTIGGDPVISGGKFGPFKWTFKTPQRTSIAVKKLYNYIQSQKQTKIAILTATDGFGKDGLNWLEQIAPEFGIEIVIKEAFSVTDTDMTPQILKIRESKAQALICWTIGPAGARVAKNVKQLGLTTPLYQCHGQPDPKYVELAGDAAEGSIMPSTKLMVADQLADTDPQKAVIKEFLSLYKDVYHFDQQYPINTHSGYAWDAILLLANAMRRVGTDPEALRSAIEQTKGYVGVSGIYNLTPEDHNGLGTDSMVMVKVEKGKWVLLQP
ncbi:MAG TPA: ABC transporter substrate-binding protein [Syntrophobacteraceae bacterium]|nr:ABC transporter substrate-binding protein [Syntrophobacteraceae bacterium]